MADVRFTPEFDDTSINNALQNLLNTTEQVEKAVGDVGKGANDGFREAAKGAEELTESINSQTAQLDKSKVRLKDNEKAVGSWRGELKDAAKDVKIFGVSINDAQAFLGKYAKGLTASTKGISGMAKGLRILKVALISTGIGAIVVLLGSLAAALSKNQKFIDRVNQAFAGLKAGVDVIIDRFANFEVTLQKTGELFKNIISLKFGAAFKQIKEEVQGVTEEFTKEIAAAAALEKAKQKLRDRTNELNVEISNQTALLEESRSVAEDDTRSIEERTAAAQKNLDLQDAIAEKRLELAEENFRITKEGNALSLSVADQKKAEAEAEVELNETRADIASQRREDESLLRELQREAADKRREEIQAEIERLQALREEYRELVQTFEDQVDVVFLDSLSDTDKVFELRDRALRDLEQLREDIIEQANTIGEDLPEDFDANFTKLSKAIVDSSEKELKKLRGITDPIELLTTIEDQDRIAENTEEVVRRIVEGYENAVSKDEVQSVFERLRDQILASLGITGDQANFFVDQFASVLESIGEISQTNLEEELKRQDQLIDKQKERVREVERALAKEQKQQEKGYANNVTALEAALVEENRALAAAERQRLETEKQAANRRLVADSVQQASQLALAASKVITAESGKGLIGIITAAAGLSLLFSIVSKAKANAAKFSKPQRLRKGAKLEGKTHEQGGVPLAVINDRGEIENMYEAEAGEILVGTQHSREHESLLLGMNQGRYKDIPLYELAEQAAGQKFVSDAKRTKQKAEEYSSLKQGQDVDLLSAAYQNASMAAAKEMIKYWKKRPELVQLEEGKVLRHYDNGSKDILNFS